MVSSLGQYTCSSPPAGNITFSFYMKASDPVTGSQEEAFPLPIRMFALIAVLFDWLVRSDGQHGGVPPRPLQQHV